MSTEPIEGGQAAKSMDAVTGNDSGKLYLRDHPSTEYTVVTSRDSDGQDTSVHLHQLLACVENDPREVFTKGTVVHHKAMTTYPVDVASNLRVMEAGEHARGHADGWLEPKSIEEVLDGE